MQERAFRRRFATKLRAARLRHGLTQRELAERAGIADKYLSRLELGLATPSLYVVQVLAQGLEVGLDDLMTATPRPTDAELGAIVRLLRGRSPGELERARRVLEQVLR